MFRDAHFTATIMLQNEQYFYNGMGEYEKLPWLVDLVRDVYSHFAHSAKRLGEYKQIQSSQRQSHTNS